MKAIRLLILFAWVVLFAFSALACTRLLCVPLADPQWYLHCAPAPYQLIDFSQFYQAGQLAVSADAAHVYDPEVQNRWAAHFVAPFVPDKIFYNQSVPFLYVLLIPFGALPYNQAYVLWCLATASLMAMALYFLLARAGYLKGSSRLLFVAGVLASISAYLTVWHGQTAFLLTAAYAFFALALMRGRPWLAGLSLALTTFKPQYLFPFIALTAGLHRGKTIVALFLFEGLLMALAALFIGPGNILSYPGVLTHAESTSRFIGVNPHYMVSIRGLLSVLLPHPTAMVVTLCLLVLAVGLLFFVAARSSRTSGTSSTSGISSTSGTSSTSGISSTSGTANTSSTFSSNPEKVRWLLCLTFLTALVVSPHSHFFDCLLLSVPAALTLKNLDLAAVLFDKDAYSSPWYRWWCGLLIVFPLLSWPLNFLPVGGRELEGAFFLLLNCILLFLAWRLLHENSSADG